ncbi:MAG: hypothetical protein AAFS03_07560, partial [Pseudomonadota bacterium]
RDHLTHRLVWVHDEWLLNKTVGQVISDAGATLKGFAAFKLGEGVEKAEDDFAAEVASMSKST